MPRFISFVTGGEVEPQIETLGLNEGGGVKKGVGGGGRLEFSSRRSDVSGGSLVDIDLLEEKLGELFEPIKRVEERYLRKIGELEEQILNLKETIVKPSACPIYDVVNIDKLEDLKRGALSLEDYRNQYIKVESRSDTNERIRLHAFLAILDDFASEGGDLKADPEEYYREATKKIDIKIRGFLEDANSEGKTLARWINDNL